MAELGSKTTETPLNPDAGEFKISPHNVSNGANANPLSFLDEVHQFPLTLITALRCRVRAGKDLNSEVVDDLGENTLVIVEEIDGRRARISKPIEGWLSTLIDDGTSTKQVLAQPDKRKQQINENVLLFDQEKNFYTLGTILDWKEKVGLFHVTAEKKEYWLSPDSGRLVFLGPNGLEALPRLGEEILQNLNPKLKGQLQLLDPNSQHPRRKPIGNPSVKHNSYYPGGRGAFAEEHHFGRYKADPSRDPRERRELREEPYGRKDDSAMIEKYRRRRLDGRYPADGYEVDGMHHRGMHPSDPRMGEHFRHRMDPRLDMDPRMEHPHDPRMERMDPRGDPRMDRIDPRADPRMVDPRADPRMDPRADPRMVDPRADPRMDPRERRYDPRMEHDPRMEPRPDPRDPRDPRNELRRPDPRERPPHHLHQEHKYIENRMVQHNESESQRRQYEYYLSKKNYERYKNREELRKQLPIGPSSSKKLKEPVPRGAEPPKRYRATPNGNILIIIRGFPGSGKTALGRSICAKFGGPSVICSEDKYHWSGGEVGSGTFRFNPEINWRTRDWCAQEVVKALNEGKPLVIVDNINYRIIHYEEHIRAAYNLGYTIKILEIVHNPELLPKFRKRCKLNLAEEEWLRLGEKWETDPRVQLLYPQMSPEEKKAAEAAKARQQNENENDLEKAAYPPAGMPVTNPENTRPNEEQKPPAEAGFVFGTSMFGQNEPVKPPKVEPQIQKEWRTNNSDPSFTKWN